METQCEVIGDEHAGEMYEIPITGTLIILHGGKNVTVNGYKAKLCRKHRDMVIPLNEPISISSVVSDKSSDAVGVLNATAELPQHKTVTIVGVDYEEHLLVCPEPGCGGTMRLRYSGKFTPPVFYGCERFPECRSSHGCHPSGRPLGVPATAGVKAARIRAHAAFDQLWKSGEMKRGDAYNWLTKAMNREKQVHIGEMGAAECQLVVSLVAERLTVKSKPD